MTIRSYRPAAVAAAVFVLAGCGGGQAPRAETADAAPAQTADQFVARINQELQEVAGESATASWVQSTYITRDTGKLAARAITQSFRQTLPRSPTQ